MIDHVIVIDTRPDWIREEDGEYACRRCSLYKKCSSRFGLDCKKLGGDEIPKIRTRVGKSNDKRKPTTRTAKKNHKRRV